MPKLLVRSAVAVRCESSRGRLRPRLFNLLDFRPCENREFSLCSVFCVSPEFRPIWLFACFSACFLDLAIYLRFWGKNRPNALRFLSRSHLGWAFTLPTSFQHKKTVSGCAFLCRLQRGCYSRSVPFAVKINAAWRAFCTILGRGRVFTLPRTFFFKILGSRLTF